LRVLALNRVGSDHNSILLDDGTDNLKIKKGFIFESAWLNKVEFKKQFIERWAGRNSEGIQAFWKRLKKEVRQLNIGMGANLDGEMRRQKTRLVSEMEELDKKS
jgi:hypothetical protein